MTSHVKEERPKQLEKKVPRAERGKQARGAGK